MIRQLYIDDMEVDIDNSVNIVRQYTSPFFSDVKDIINNGTYTVKVPQTERNAAIQEYLDREDMNTDFPYTLHTAKYYVNAFPIFENAEVKVLAPFEWQFVWGVNKTKYLPVFNNKLNEIEVNGTTITESDWIANWNKTDMYASGKKYKFPYYTSSERKVDVEYDSGGNPLDYIFPAEPLKSCLKKMTQHPYISAENILDLINLANGLSIDFTEMKTKLTNKGIILNGIESRYEKTSGNVDVDILNQGGSLIINPKYFNFISTTNQFIFGEIKSFHVYYNLRSFYVFKKVGGASTCTLTINVIDAKTGDTVETHTHTGFTDTIDIDGVTYNIYSFEDVIFDYLIEGDTRQHYVRFSYDSNASATTHTVPLSSNNQINYSIVGTFFNANNSSGIYNNTGMYDCLANLPDMTQIEFIQQMLIHTGGGIGFDANGDLKIIYLDTLSDNIASGNVYDWSGKFTPTKGSVFQFNSNARKNYIKFANDEKLTGRNEYLQVSDLTIESEKDLYKLDFDSPQGLENTLCEYILYSQTIKTSKTDGVSFTNEYKGDNYKPAFVKFYNDTCLNINVIDGNYDTYQKIIDRPIIKEGEVNMDFYESANIDFEKPIYIKEFGKYAVLLDLQCPDNEVCVAKLLLINQTI